MAFQTIAAVERTQQIKCAKKYLAECGEDGSEEFFKSCIFQTRHNPLEDGLHVRGLLKGSSKL
jgi:hypothetical protein